MFSAIVKFSGEEADIAEAAISVREEESEEDVASSMDSERERVSRTKDDSEDWVDSTKVAASDLESPRDDASASVREAES